MTQAEEACTASCFITLWKDREALMLMEGQETKRVLLVDDEDIILASVRHALLRMGYGVVAVKSGAEALKVFNQDPSLFSLVITDQTMPRMTGIELARKLICVRSDIPIILCTGMNHTVSEKEREVTGIRELLCKPASMRDLKTVVSRVLEN